MVGESDETLLTIALESLRMDDVALVGGKNASLGEMIGQLASFGVRVPGGFATTSHAFREFLQQDHLADRIAAKLSKLDTDDVRALAATGAEIRGWILNTSFPSGLEGEVRARFAALSANHPDSSYAVRSSATAEDLPDASFAGQQESFLNVVGVESVLHCMKAVFASLYNNRAISYRAHHGFAHEDVALSVGVQRMVRSDCGAAGVMFTLDTESGFPGVVFITSSYGLGELVVQGAVNPDEFYVHKPMLEAGRHAVIRRSLGSKLQTMRFATPAERAVDGRMVAVVETSEAQRSQYSLTGAQVLQLARYGTLIEAHYGRPMDIEWGLDGLDGQLYILQGRPETVKSQGADRVEQRYQLKGRSAVLAEGRAIGQKIGIGVVRIVADSREMERVQQGDVLVTDMTDPNWEPIMKRASAVVTNRGGRTCHAAIIARELGIPAVVGCGNATEKLVDGSIVTVVCSEGDTGLVYEGELETLVIEVKRAPMPDCPVKIMMNVGNPQLAFEFAQIPNNGVGLARLEFIINNNIGIHPNAILDYPDVPADLRAAIELAARGHATPRAFYVEKIAEGVATIAAAFWPKPVIVRLSDFKSNEYRKMVGGTRYEPLEENPMLGFRGASRYLSGDFAEAFAMECEALKYVRDHMGLTNVQIMVPFVRTLAQARTVTEILADRGLGRGEVGLRLIMMCEVPTNAILAPQYLAFFDGMSIGSNDLTQLTLGLDRDSGLAHLASDFDERDPAVKSLISAAISACREAGKYVGICGQGPSDHPDFAAWLAKEGIQSISLNPDSVINTWQQLSARN